MPFCCNKSPRQRNVQSDLTLHFRVGVYQFSSIYVIVFESLRLQRVHTYPDSLRFQKFPLWRPFSKVCGYRISHSDWERSDPSNLIDVIQDHRAKIGEGKTYANDNIACQESSFNPGRRVPWSQQVFKQNEDRGGLSTISPNILQQNRLPQHDLTNQYPIPTRITSREKIQSQSPNWQRDKHSTKTCQAKEFFGRVGGASEKTKCCFSNIIIRCHYGKRNDHGSNHFCKNNIQ